MKIYTLSNFNLVCDLAIGAVPIDDAATREKRLFGSEHTFGYFDLILDRVPKYSIKQSLLEYSVNL